MPTVLEGLWEEIVAQSDALKGKRVRVEVLEPAPTEKTPTNPLDALVGLIPAEEGSGEASLSVHHDETCTRADETTGFCRHQRVGSVGLCRRGTTRSRPRVLSAVVAARGVVGDLRLCAG